MTNNGKVTKIKYQVSEEEWILHTSPQKNDITFEKKTKFCLPFPKSVFRQPKVGKKYWVGKKRPYWQLTTAAHLPAGGGGGEPPSLRPLHPPWAKRIGTFWFSFLFKGISGGEGKISSFKNSLRTKNKNIKNIAKTRFALKISYTNRLSNSRRIDWHNQFENRGGWVKLDFYRHHHPSSS